MADYRLSAQIIKRSEGKSSVASAAYRSAERLIDERTGEAHDYGRKAGVIHAEVMTPEGTPDWMHDRAQLWNSVEAIERRKDAQLAREIQLSLPHELNREQRLELARGFVQEQFVNQGMIADVAIHEPTGGSDDRNHHAHVMLTMRELAGDGFGKKNRDWNSPETLANWREQWAHHQNRELERHGHDARVDHRSYEAQGVDREPTQHLGPAANDMERNGKDTRIGDENRARQERNELRAQWYAAEFALAQEIARRASKFSKWRDQKSREIENAQDLAKLDLAQKQDRLRDRLKADQKERHGTAKATIKAQIDTIDRNQQATGVRKVLRAVFGKAKAEREERTELAATLQNIAQREREERERLERHLKLERKQANERQEARKERADQAIKHRQEQLRAKNHMARRESLESRPNFERKAKADPSQKYEPRPTIERMKPSKPAFEQANENTRPQKTPIEARTEGKGGSKSPKATPTAQAHDRATEPRDEPLDKLSLDDKKRVSDTHLTDKSALGGNWKAEAQSGWKDRANSWEAKKSEHWSKDKGRDRSPSGKPTGGSKKP